MRREAADRIGWRQPRPSCACDAGRVLRRPIELLHAQAARAPLWMMVGLTVIGGLLGLGLRETAPRVLARRPVDAT